MTAYEIVRASGETGERLLPIQVYRSLERLMRNRQVERIATIGAFVPEAGAKSLHFLCIECGTHDPEDAIEAHRLLDAICKSNRFAPREIHLEISGQCSRCAG